MLKRKREISIVITICRRITIQGLYCYLDMGNNTVMYYKCSHVPNLVSPLHQHDYIRAMKYSPWQLLGGIAFYGELDVFKNT